MFQIFLGKAILTLTYLINIIFYYFVFKKFNGISTLILSIHNITHTFKLPPRIFGVYHLYMFTYSKGKNKTQELLNMSFRIFFHTKSYKFFHPSLEIFLQRKHLIL